MSGACSSDFGHHVVCVGKDEREIAALLETILPICEPSLADLSYVFPVARVTAENLTKNSVIVTTVPVGTGAEVERNWPR